MGAEGSISKNTESGKETGKVALTNNPFQSSNHIIAGKLKVKHPLMDEELIIFGFVIHDRYTNLEDFKIQGLKIKYQYQDDNEISYEIGENSLIYSKILFDNKTKHFSKYFGVNANALFRGKAAKYRSSQPWPTKVENIEDKYYVVDDYAGCGKLEYKESEKFDFYLYSNLMSDVPECATNENVYAVCKYREAGVFKYAIFNFHELIPVSNQ